MVARKPNTPAAPKTDAKETTKREPKQYAKVSLSDLKPVKVTKEDKVTVLPGRERSEEQKAVDATVKDLAYEYLKAGSPKNFRDMPVVSYTLPTDQATTVKFMVQKACNLLNCKPKFGRQAWDNGLEVVSFCPIPRDPSQWQDKPVEDKPVEKTADETPKESENGTPRTDPSSFMKQDA